MVGFPVDSEAVGSGSGRAVLPWCVGQGRRCLSWPQTSLAQVRLHFTSTYVFLLLPAQSSSPCPAAPRFPWAVSSLPAFAALGGGLFQVLGTPETLQTEPFSPRPGLWGLANGTGLLGNQSRGHTERMTGVLCRLFRCEKILCFLVLIS